MSEDMTNTEVTIIPNELAPEKATEKVEGLMQKLHTEYFPLARELDEVYRETENFPIEKPSTDEEYQRLSRLKKSITTPLNRLETEGKNIRRDMKQILNDPTLDMEKTMKQKLNPVKDSINEYLEDYKYEQRKIENAMVLEDRRNRLTEAEFQFIDDSELPNEDNLLSWDDKRFLEYFNNLKQLESERKEEQDKRLARDEKIKIISEHNLQINTGEFSVSFETIDSSTVEEIKALCEDLYTKKKEEEERQEKLRKEQEMKREVVVQRKTELKGVGAPITLTDDALYWLSEEDYTAMYNKYLKLKQEKEEEKRKEKEQKEKEAKEKREAEKLRKEENQERVNAFLKEHNITEEMLEKKEAKIERTQAGDYAVYTLVGYINLD